MSRRILIVDDEPDIRALASISLERIGGHEVRTAASGAQCLAELSDWRPDVVLMDVMMPGMDGPTTLERIRSDPAIADIPVVFLTASVVDSELDRLRASSVAGVLAKPFDAMRLSAELGALLAW